MRTLVPIEAGVRLRRVKMRRRGGAMGLSSGDGRAEITADAQLGRHGWNVACESMGVGVWARACVCVLPIPPILHRILTPAPLALLLPLGLRQTVGCGLGLAGVGWGSLTVEGCGHADVSATLCSTGRVRRPVCVVAEPVPQSDRRVGIPCVPPCRYLTWHQKHVTHFPFRNPKQGSRVRTKTSIGSGDSITR